MNPVTTTALRLTGRDVLLVLHRVSTQKLSDLGAGECRTTLLCDFRGRLQHRFVVAHRSDQSVWLLRSDAPGAHLAAAIDRCVFREDVLIEDRSAEFPVTALQLPSTLEAQQLAGMASDPAIPQWVRESPSVVLFVGSPSEHATLLPGSRPLDAALAITQGRARQGHEIVEEFNPFEVGLSEAVHLDKGCFTGQESLQRLITYSSVRRQLVGVQGSGVLPATPQQVLSGTEDAGMLTSVAAADAGWTGLAVLRRNVVESGAGLTLSDGTGVDVAQAFTLARPLGRP